MRITFSHHTEKRNWDSLKSSDREAWIEIAIELLEETEGENLEVGFEELVEMHKEKTI